MNTTLSATKFIAGEKEKRTAYLIAWASILQIAESLIPSPIPGIKLGLANMITIVALVDMGMYAAIEIAILRTIISSFIMGTFLSPTFFLSFTSALASSIVMGLIYVSAKKSNKVILSLIGISLIGSITHNSVQITLVFAFLIKNKSIFLLMPWLGISSVIMGLITGFVASSVCQKLSNPKHPTPNTKRPTNGTNKFEIAHYHKGNSVIHNFYAPAKIIFVFLTALSLLIFEDYFIYSSIFITLLMIAAASKIPFSLLFAGVRRLKVIIFIAFILPALFTGGNDLIFKYGVISITQQGINEGIMFAARIIILMFSAAILVKSTDPHKLAKGIGTLLKPFSFAGFSGERTAEIILMAWNTIPILWDRAVEFVKLHRHKKGTGLLNIIDGLAEMIAGLYKTSKDEIIL